MSETRPLLGLSPNFEGPDAGRERYPNKELQYTEASMARSLYAAGALPLLLPDVLEPGAFAELIARVDALVLTGGSDVAPESYGAPPIARGRWPGEARRDRVEGALVRAALMARKPVLAICRGVQLLNVALGGTLVQDIATERPGSLLHRDQERYDRLAHAVTVEPDSWVAAAYGGARELVVNSVHHQAIAELAEPLRAVARAPDGTVEAVQAQDPELPVYGVQWHPEWLPDEAEPGGRASGLPLLRHFVARCRER